VFRLYDTRTGQAAEIALPPGGLLRMLVAGPPHRPAHAGDLRTFLVADLIRRNAERRHDLSVVATMIITGQEHDDGFLSDTSALNIQPADQTAGAQTAAGSVASREIIVGSYRVRTGPVLFEGQEDAGTAPLADMAGRGLDPLALRLAYLSGRYREQADLTWDMLGDADEQIRRWRESVGRWAELPSKPMCAQVTAQVAAAFDDDLDTPAALRALQELEQDPEIPAGSKFESFLRADQLLGLDLPRDIGRVP
jgi:cysteinyl-tRNA synthetase